MTTQTEERLAKYPATERFRVIDTIGVPHPYCISAKHVVHASDCFGGMLGREAIESAERKGIHCDICRKKNRKDGTPILSHSEHEQALLIEVDDPADNLKDVQGLQEYLLSIKEMANKDNYAGFAFKKK